MENTAKPPFLQLNAHDQKLAVEALIFASEEPVSNEFLFKILILHDVSSSSKNLNNYYNSVQNETEPENEQITLNDEIRNRVEVSNDYFIDIVEEINKDLFQSHRPFHIINIAGGWQFATRPEYGELLQRLVKAKVKRRFSQASLETLAIIAYRQPITKAEVEQIRGVNSAEIINTLFEKKLVDIVGRKDSLGKPLLYGATTEFLRIFGLQSFEQLPKLREFDNLGDNSDNENMIEITVESEDVQALQETNPPPVYDIVEDEETTDIKTWDIKG